MMFTNYQHVEVVLRASIMDKIFPGVTEKVNPEMHFVRSAN